LNSSSSFDWLLLKRVSRSFYLTLRLLPGAVRESISLAYLLARFTDTEADGAVSEAEKELLGRRGDLDRWLAASPDRDEIDRVWKTIQEGQAFDQKRFGREGCPNPPTSRTVGDNGPCQALSDEELDRYTYLVAGCVGEFWTRICSRRIPGFARLPEAEMCVLGIHFGKGLQLVNILRDRHADRKLGRVYVPEARFPEVLAQAREHLVDASRYVAAVKGIRLRTACALPLLLARETLDLVEKQPAAARVKVPRSRVWRLLVCAGFFRG
jgi:farnesyl-diphosphate farnesyltransferase